MLDHRRRRPFTSTALLLAAFLTSCTTAPEQILPAPALIIGANLAMPPYYRVQGDGGADVLLMGTFHLGPPPGWQLSPALESGLSRADRFVLEVDPRLATEDAVSDLLARRMFLEPPSELKDVVSPETAKLLEELDDELIAIGIPANARRRMKPWFVVMSLIEVNYRGSGYSADRGAEQIIMRSLSDRPLVGLESFEEQIAILDDMSPMLQDLMLRHVLMRLGEALDDIRELVSAWQRGDETRLQELARQGVDVLPELEAFYDILSSERNRSWLPKLRAYLDEPTYAGETVFIGVGASHLIGDDGLVDLLREAGYSVEPIDHLREPGAEVP